MPVSLLNTDTSFPSFQKETPVKERVERLTDYLYMLLEELRYTFGNLGAENFNDNGLEELGKVIAGPLYVKVQNAEEAVSELTVDVDENTAAIKTLTEWKTEASETITSVEQTAGQNEAKITALTQWRSQADSELDGLAEAVAILEIEADANGASISQIVSAVGSNGRVTAASIVTAVNNAGSSVKISADHVDISGFVTFTSLETDGGSTINGNNISLLLDGSYDDGYTSLSSGSSLNYNYITYSGYERSMARIYTSVDGEDDDISSRYALNIEALPFRNNNGTNVWPALKLFGAGRVSVECNDGVYIATYNNGGYITLNGIDNTRIIANKSYRNLIEPADYGTDMYCFCTDGIYYNGDLILPT